MLPAADGAQSPKRMVGRYLQGLTEKAFAARAAAYEKLKTPEQCQAYQHNMREQFIHHLGGFPQRTPLNAKVVGKLEGDGYRAEKVIYESQPQHYVTAVLFLPAGGEAKPPYPAVLVPCGHSRNGKAANQRVCILLAKFGIAAMSYDPIGQGERYQFLDAEGKPRFKPTTEHTALGAGCIPLGRGTATYRIWDGMRSIDYLVSRKDIDGEKIGVTGCSGGGTLTSYLMALDHRVQCAAPSCYLTSLPRLLATIGPQDAEQNIFGQIAIGLDHADYVMLRAPRPTLILASTHDFFDIDGSWDTFRQAKRFYTRLGFPERVNLVETDAKHGFPQLQREAMLRWMRRWMQGIDQHATEPEFATHSESDVQCSPRGQVMLIDGARSVVDLNVQLNEQLAAGRKKIWQPEIRRQALEEVGRIAGIRRLAHLPPAKSRAAGKVERDGYHIEKLVLEVEDGIVLPALLFVPQKPSGSRTLYVHGEGKHVDAQGGGAIEKLVKQGQLVLAVDVRGCGETGPGGAGMWGGNWNDIFISYLLGKSPLGMRAEDVLQSARFLAGHSSKNRAGKVNLVAIGVAGPPALHAAALEQALFENVTLKESLRSWSDVVAHPDAPGQLGSVIHGALRVYDLPDLAAALPSEKVTIEAPLRLGQ